MAGAQFSAFSGPLIWSFFGIFLDPCWTHVGLLFVANRPLGLRSVSPWDPVVASFVSLDVFCHPGGAIAGSWAASCSSFEPICCSRAPGNCLVVFEVILTSISSFHAPHSNKEPTSFQVDNSKGFTPPSESVSQICYKKWVAHSSCRAKRGTYV